MIPVVRKSRAGGEMAAVSSESPITTEMRKEPTTFTIRVPRGKSGPHVVAAQLATRYRETEPSAPPKKTRTTLLTRERTTWTAPPRQAGGSLASGGVRAAGAAAAWMAARDPNGYRHRPGAS